MIFVDKGTVVVKGPAPVVMTEMQTLVKHFNESNEKKFGKERSEEIINMIIEDASKSDEQIRKENEELKAKASDILGDILKTIMEGMGE